MTLTWLGHSTVVIDLDGVRVLTDPLLRLLRGVPLMSDPANVAWLRRRKLEPVQLLGDGWTPLGRGVEVRQVPVVHAHRPMPHRPNATNGHLVRGRSGTAWVAGDTELHPEMQISRTWPGTCPLSRRRVPSRSPAPASRYRCSGARSIHPWSPASDAAGSSCPASGSRPRSRSRLREPLRSSSNPASRGLREA